MYIFIYVYIYVYNRRPLEDKSFTTEFPQRPWVESTNKSKKSKLGTACDFFTHEPRWRRRLRLLSVVAPLLAVFVCRMSGLFC